jgi:hypothetical protein
MCATLEEKQRGEREVKEGNSAGTTVGSSAKYEGSSNKLACFTIIIKFDVDSSNMIWG